MPGVLLFDLQSERPGYSLALAKTNQ